MPPCSADEDSWEGDGIGAQHPPWRDLLGQLATVCTALEAENECLRQSQWHHTSRPEPQGDTEAALIVQGAMLEMDPSICKRPRIATARPQQVEVLDEQEDDALAAQDSYGKPQPSKSSAVSSVVAAETPKTEWRKRTAVVGAQAILHPEFMESPGPESGSVTGTGSTVLVRDAERYLSSCSIRAGDAILDHSCPLLQRLVLRPCCRRRLVWEVVCFLMVMYEVLFIPLQLLPMPASPALFWVETSAMLFWTADLLGSFFVGYYDSGALEMRPRKIAAAYARSFLILDATIVVTDWVLIALQIDQAEALGVLRTGKALRIARALRLVHILRLAKVISFTEEIEAFLRSEGLRTCFGISKLIFAIVLANHYIACVWYAIGASASPNAQHGRYISWLDHLKTQAGDEGEVGLSLLYATSLHWALTQFTPASMEVVPQNVYERIFNVVVILFALVSFSSFVSSITNAMTLLRKINEEKWRHEAKLREFIMANKLSIEVGNMIYAYAKRIRNGKMPHVTLNEIEALKTMPQKMRRRIHYELHAPVIVQLSFFQHFQKRDPNAFMSICHDAVSQVIAAAGEEPLRYGDMAQSMLVFQAGRCIYSSAEDEDISINSGQILAEMCLWIRWVHRGSMHTLTDCSITKVNSHKFRRIVLQSQSLDRCRDYATKLLARVQQEEISDLWTCNDIALEVFAVPTMDAKARFRHRLRRSSSDIAEMSITTTSRMRTSLWSMASTPASYATRSSRLASVTSFRRWSKGSSR